MMKTCFTQLCAFLSTLSHKFFGAPEKEYDSWIDLFKAVKGYRPSPLDIKSHGWEFPIELSNYMTNVSDRIQLFEIMVDNFESWEWISDEAGVIWFRDGNDAVRFKLML
jgi:hypothetical protein